MDGVAPLIEEEFTGQGEKAGSFFSGSFGTAMKVGITAAAAAAGVVIKESLEQGAALEQSIGGIETMFGAGGKSLVEYAEAVGKTSLDVKEEYAALMTAQEQVFANAEAAYQTAGMSRNAYMENVTSFSAALTCMSNVGPGLDAVGPAGNFSSFSALSKAVLSACMVIGRLEIFPILVLFSRGAWTRT